MPLSHLTLTVSHLPTSTSFFLSCLQPLGYKFIGRHDEYIGFGSKADEPADFWLAQEQPGYVPPLPTSNRIKLLTRRGDGRTPAGAAHIAFPAPSKEAVNTFFISALKAGGKIHGEPKCRDTETGYFSAAVVDFDGNSIEAVYRPDLASSTSGSRSEAGSVARSERTRGPSALQTIKNGSVVSRARSVRTTEDRAVQAAIENIPPSRVKMLDQQAPPQQAVYQQAYAPSSDNSISAKTIIGTLLGATAGAALAYAMIKGDSSSNSSSPPQSSAPVPASAPSQYVQQPPQQQQQQQQPHQMSMSLPMLMPMLGPAPGYQEQTQQQPVYRALEAPPTVMAPSQAARSVYTANDAISAYTRSTAPKSKSPRADTIYEETEYYPPITEGTPRSLYSQEASTINGGGGSGVRRTSNGSVYATRELPIRAIEYGMSTVSSQQSSQSSQSQSQKVRSKSYPCDPSTFISSYAETRQLQQQQQQGHIIGEAESDFSSISTIKPVPAAKSVMSASSHRSSATKSSKHSSSQHRHDEDLDAARSTSSSNRTAAHKVALPDSRPGSTYTSATKTSKRSSASTIKEIKHSRDRERESLVDAFDIPLPASAAPSTVFLDAVVDITPEDSISQVGISHHNHNHNHNHSDNKSSSGRSHRSRSGPSSHSQAASTTTSKREKETESGSKFDQPIKPSDSISQVSSNNHRSHHSHHSHNHSHASGHRGSSRVSERSASGKKSHSGGSIRSGHY